MKFIGQQSEKSYANDYMVAMSELANLEENEPEDDVLLPMDIASIFAAKSAIDEVLADYEMSSTAVEQGIVLHDAKTIGPSLIGELKNALVDVSYKALGASIGGAPKTSAGSPQDEIDRDGDGFIFDGTPQEQRVPYKRRDGKPVGGGPASGMEARRRQFVRSEAERQGVSLNRERRAGGPGRSEQERQFRTEARARFDRIALQGQGFIPPDRIEAGDKRNFENRMGDVNAGRTDSQGRSGFGAGGQSNAGQGRQGGGYGPTAPQRPAPGSIPPGGGRGSYGPTQDNSNQQAEDARNNRLRPQKPVDRLQGAGPANPGAGQGRGSYGPGRTDNSNQRAETARQGLARPQRPVDRLGAAGGPGYDESSNRAENARQQGMRPADTSSQRSETARQGLARPQRPVDRLGAAGGPGYDESSNRAESARQQGMKPADTSSQRAESARQGLARPQRPVDRLGVAGGPGYDESSNRAESSRMGRSKPQDTSSQRAENSRNNRSRPRGPVDRMAGSGSRRADGSSNTAERNRMNRSRPADNSSQRNESSRQGRAASGTRNAQQRPPDRIQTQGNRPRRFPRGANDYYYGGNA